MIMLYFVIPKTTDVNPGTGFYRIKEKNMFLFKNIIGPFFDPLSICLAIFTIGLIMLWFTKKQRSGKVLVTIGLVFLILAGYDWFSAPFIKPLESKYPAMMPIPRSPGIKYIVVLGAGVSADNKIPPNAQLSITALARLIEGIRIHNALPQTRLVLSGGLMSNNVSEAQAMAKTASSLGIAPQKMILDAQSKDTEDQARLIKQIVGNDRFILVTTASHMPRSIALVKKLGLNPIPAPTDYRVKGGRREITPGKFFPNSSNVMMMELAMHEYLGIAWAKLRGRI